MTTSIASESTRTHRPKMPTEVDCPARSSTKGCIHAVKLLWPWNVIVSPQINAWFYEGTLERS